MIPFSKLIFAGNVWVTVHHDEPLTEEQQKTLKEAIVIKNYSPPPENLERIFEVMD